MPPTSDKSNLITTDPAAAIVNTEERRRNGIVSRLFRLRRSPESATTTKNKARKKKPLDKNYVNETDDESCSSSSSSSFDIIDRILAHLDAGQAVAPDPSRLGTATYDIPDSSIHSCLKLLSSEDLDRNRVGLQRLVMLTKGRTLSGLYRSEEIASHMLVFGGPFGSVEEQLRYVFTTMICDAPHEDHQEDYLTTPLTEFDDEKEALFDWILDYDPITGVDGNRNHISSYDDDCSCGSHYLEDMECKTLHPQGKAEGALHNHALRVLANALGRVASSTKTESTTETEQIPLQGPLWKNIIRTLVENIESNYNADTTGYSMKILRLLHSIHPETIEPLLKYSLLDHLVFFTDYGKCYQFPMIYSEASYLLRQTRHNSELW